MTKQQILKLPTSVKVDGDWQTREVYVNGRQLNPVASQKIWNHSPDGFNWGYGGSGPAQFALALLLRFMTKEEAQKYYHSFKFKWVAALPQSDFETILNLREVMTEIIESKSTTANP